MKTTKNKISPYVMPGLGKLSPVSIMHSIETVVCEIYGIKDRLELSIHTRKRSIADPRHICMYLGRHYLEIFKRLLLITESEAKELTTIAIGDRYDHDHATVLHAVRKVTDLMEFDRIFSERILKIKSLVNHLICPELNARSKDSEKMGLIHSQEMTF